MEEGNSAPSTPITSAQNSPSKSVQYTKEYAEELFQKAEREFENIQNTQLKMGVILFEYYEVMKKVQPNYTLKEFYERIRFQFGIQQRQINRIFDAVYFVGELAKWNLELPIPDNVSQVIPMQEAGLIVRKTINSLMPLERELHADAQKIWVLVGERVNRTNRLTQSLVQEVIEENAADEEAELEANEPTPPKKRSAPRRKAKTSRKQQKRAAPAKKLIQTVEEVEAESHISDESEEEENIEDEGSNSDTEQNETEIEVLSDWVNSFAKFQHKMLGWSFTLDDQTESVKTKGKESTRYVINVEDSSNNVSVRKIGWDTLAKTIVAAVERSLQTHSEFQVGDKYFKELEKKSTI